MYESSKPMRDVGNYLSITEANRLIDGIDNPRNRLIALTLLRTGRRISEILGRPVIERVGKTETGINESTGKKKYRYDYMFVKDRITGRFVLEGGLRVRDIDFESGVANYSILKKKGGLTYRTLQVDSELLQEWKVWIADNKLEPDARLFNINRKRFHVILRKYADRLGVLTVGGKPLSAHKFRHTFAIQAAKTIDNPQGIKWVKDNLAHSDIGTTMFYITYNPKESKKILKGMWEKDKDAD